VVVDVREAEVDDLRDALAVGLERQEHVLGLEVAVHDPGGVRGLERVQHLREEVDHVGDGRRARAARQPRAQVLAAEQLHHEEEQAVVFTEVEDAHDVAVREEGRGVRLAAEAAHVLVHPGDVRVHHLHGHVDAEREVRRAVHLAHAAHAEARAELVLVREDAAREQLWRGRRARAFVVGGRGAVRAGRGGGARGVLGGADARGG
jgi:hypothetical protein